MLPYNAGFLSPGPEAVAPLMERRQRPLIEPAGGGAFPTRMGAGLASGSCSIPAMIEPSFFARFWPALLLVLGVAAALWPLLALPAAFASLVGLLALPLPSARDLPRPRVWLLLGTLAASVGMARFVVLDAVPGIIGGGRRAVEDQVVSRLRDVLFAEDAMRRAGWIDPDRDGIGSAAFLSELCGGEPLRGQAPRATPVLHCEQLEQSALGPAARLGAYLYAVCLPRAGGGWSARPGEGVDEEAAERRFVAYAWPVAESPFSSLYFIDEHENIRVGPTPSTAGEPPHCDAALSGPPWPAWKDKKARPLLPGDSAPEAPNDPAPALR